MFTTISTNPPRNMLVRFFVLCLQIGTYLPHVRARAMRTPFFRLINTENGALRLLLCVSES
jgi:hypothetical protein